MILTAYDRYSVTIPYADVINNTNYLIAPTMNDQELPQYIPDMYSDVDLPAWPLLFVDPTFSGYDMTIGQVKKSVFNNVF